MINEVNDFTPVLGAESRIDLIDWHGKFAIRKKRIPKSYRIETLDKQLRERRTKEEVEILHTSKLAGVECPQIFFADPESSEIIMEYVPGILLKDTMNDKHFEKREVLEQLGRYASKLHAKGIIHGDLTTKNVILASDRMVLIDFGLAFISDRIEDKAEDLHLLKQVLKSSNSMRKAVDEFEDVMKGYEIESGEKITNIVRRQISKIERRGRYAQVD
ncbi:MAG TPA: KEOPS complex kinase/ATPase Bud32 [Nitrososphaerales archaeon]|nr:KEOPS complex kinase/ATPase Bud32 [Nitrososphaerales archaeon]